MSRIWVLIVVKWDMDLILGLMVGVVEWEIGNSIGQEMVSRGHACAPQADRGLPISRHQRQSWRDMELAAYVFCDCFEQGRLKRQPPNPEIVVVLPNGDLGYTDATPVQHAAFVAWRTHACRHPEGRVTGGKLGNRLPIEMLRDALAPHRSAFPVLVGKVLNCKPHTRTSHLTFKTVQKLPLELDRFETFRCGDRKLDREVQDFCGQMKQLVRAALKFGKPIAM